MTLPGDTGETTEWGYVPNLPYDRLPPREPSPPTEACKPRLELPADAPIRRFPAGAASGWQEGPHQLVRLEDTEQRRARFGETGNPLTTSQRLGRPPKATAPKPKPEPKPRVFVKYLPALELIEAAAHPLSLAEAITSLPDQDAVTIANAVKRLRELKLITSRPFCTDGACGAKFEYWPTKRTWPDIAVYRPGTRVADTWKKQP